MKKYLLAVFLVHFIILFISCQTSDLNTVQPSTGNIVKVMTPKVVSNEVLSQLTEVVPYIDFVFSDRVDFSKDGCYLVILIDGYNKSDVYKQAAPLTGLNPQHGVGGIANGKIVFTYLELSGIDSISFDFSYLINKGNFFPPKMMDLFDKLANGIGLIGMGFTSDTGNTLISSKFHEWKVFPAQEVKRNVVMNGIIDQDSPLNTFFENMDIEGNIQKVIITKDWLDYMSQK